MLDFLFSLFVSSDFPSRWRSGSWSAGLGWLHILSDLAIGSAYWVILLLIMYYLSSRKEVSFLSLHWLIGVSLFLCGTVHLCETLAFWNPLYRFSGLLKVATAIVSWISVIAVILALPKAIRLPRLATMNAELKRANLELNEFAHIVSHDLKAPLRAITSLVKWISEDTSGTREDFRENIALLTERTQRMEELINGILKYSRIGMKEREFEDIDTGDLVREIVGSLEASERFEVRIEPNMPVVRYDRAMLIQVFQNLISNAFENNSKESALVDIGFVSDRDVWLFHICDDGEGIPREDFERIFKIFQTGRSQDKKESAGVGLSIVKKIVHSMGGTIQVKSDLGKGTCFNFTIPKRTTELDHGGLFGNWISWSEGVKSYSGEGN